MKGDILGGKITANDIRAAALLKALPQRLGGLEWRCLAVKSNRALLITKDIVEKRAYHEIDEITDDFRITWEGCILRQYLNGAFLQRFSPKEGAAILETELSNDDNEYYGIDGGNPTKDKIFLLSAEEADQYFSSDEDRVAYFDGKETGWQLRSPGFLPYYSANVLENGYITIFGSPVNGAGGVRPALWLNLQPALELRDSKIENIVLEPAVKKPVLPRLKGEQ